MPSKVRAVLAGVTVSCGVMSFDVDLVPATRAKADKRAANNKALTRICPTCTDPVRVKQVLQCENGHGPLSQTELAYAVEGDDGDLRKVDPDDVADAKAPTVESKTVTFSVFPAPQVEAETMPSGNIYRMRLPAKASRATMQAYGVLLDLVGDTELAFLAELVVKGVSKLYRGSARDGMITLAELYRPSLFHEPDGAEVETTPRLIDAGRAMVAEMIGDFDPAGWESAAEQRLQALRKAAETGKPVENPAMAVTVTAQDLLNLLHPAA